MFTFGEVVTVYGQLIPITVSVCSLVHMVTCIYHVTLVIYMFVELAMCRTLIQKYREIRSTRPWSFWLNLKYKRDEGGFPSCITSLMSPCIIT